MRILWLKTELLHPIDKGGRIRTYHTLRYLARRHHVVYLTLDDGSATDAEVAAASEYCAGLVRIPHGRSRKFGLRFWIELARNLFSPLPYFIERYRSKAMRDAIARIVEEEGIELVVCDFLNPVVNLPSALPCPTLLFQHNVEAEIWRRHAEVAPDPLRRALFRSQWRRARRFERRACRGADLVVAVSERDRETLEREHGLEGVRVVETGVDLDYFRPAGERESRSGHIVFTGSMDWLPNVDGTRWFVSEILPRIRAAVSGATFAIVGRDPAPAVRQLAEGDPGITVTGTVPDIRPWVEEAAVYVVPLRVGGGTRLKIYEAMALERPVVSTPVGMEGLPLRAGEELLVAEEPEAFAREVIDLLSRPERAAELGRRGAARVRRDFGWEGVAGSFAALCEEAVGGGRPSAEVPDKERDACA